MAAVEPAARRLGGDSEVELEALLLDEVLPAQAVAILLDDGEGEPDRIAPRVGRFLEDARGGDHRGGAAELVGGSAAEHEAVFYDARVGRRLPLARVAHSDRIDVGVEDENLLPLSDPPEEAAQAVGVDVLHPRRLAHLGEELDPVLLRAAEAGTLIISERFFAV